MRRNRDYFKNIDHNKSGLLDRLDGEVYDICKNYLNQIDYDRVNDETNLFAVAPAIRNILGKILKTDVQLPNIKSRPELESAMIKLFDVNDVIDQLNNIYLDLMPIAINRLKMVDMEVEIMNAFSVNYVRELELKVIKELELTVKYYGN